MQGLIDSPPLPADAVAVSTDVMNKGVGKSLVADAHSAGEFELKVFGFDGNLKEYRPFKKNVITNTGKAEQAGLILTDTLGSVTAFDYIAIGTGTNVAVAADTTLQTEITTNGGQRSTGTGTRVTTSVTNDTSQLVVTFTFTGSFAVTESGVLNAASVGTLLCRQVFSAVNVVSGDTLQITWKIQHS